MIITHPEDATDLDRAFAATADRFPVEAYIRFSDRWRDHYIGLDYYVGSGLPFRVVQVLAYIEGRAAWDRVGGQKV